ncbi:translation initiation factor eIF 4e-like domain-containing protein [Cryomyces antarcticus]
MAQPPSRLRELSADSPITSSPARGAEMRASLLQKLRPPPLVHAWDFWHDRADRRAPTSTTTTAALSPSSPNTAPSYEARLAHLSAIRDVRSFWATLNNFPLASLPLRDSIHLFHHGTAPVWEDARNVRGGAWTFRVPKPAAAQFWREVCMMAVGEQLQAAVQNQARGQKRAFSDDITTGSTRSTRASRRRLQLGTRRGRPGLERLRQHGLRRRKWREGMEVAGMGRRSLEGAGSAVESTLWLRRWKMWAGRCRRWHCRVKPCGRRSPLSRRTTPRRVWWCDAQRDRGWSSGLGSESKTQVVCALWSSW